jgi:hypothetical protein
VTDDDEILERYERDLSEPEPPRARSNRGFWLVMGTMLFACMFLVVEIFANRDVKDTIAHAEYSLRAGQGVAEAVFERDGTFEDADARGMDGKAPPLVYVEADTPSGGLDQLSVAASDSMWAAAVQVRPGACFYLRLTAAGDVFYGNGTDCRATAALEVTDSRW